MRRATYAELAAERGLGAPLPTSFGSFAAFGDTIVAAARLIDSAAVVERVLDETLADAARDGVVWLELSAWPGLFAGQLDSDLEAVDVALRAGCRAAATHGVGFGLVVAANRDRGPEAALQVALIAASRVSQGVTGFGLDGDEAASPPAPFAAAFAVAWEAGLQAVPHAGELAGAASVSDASMASKLLMNWRHVGASRLCVQAAADSGCKERGQRVQLTARHKGGRRTIRKRHMQDFLVPPGWIEQPPPGLGNLCSIH